MILAGDDPPAEVRRQLSRWTASGRFIQLRRGLYALAPPHRKTDPHPFAIAARLRRPSYVSLESPLAYHGLIPESVPVVTSVTTARPGEVETPVGGFVYSQLGRVPNPGDRFTAAGLQVEVLTTAGRRIRRVKVSRLAEVGEEDEGPAEG